MANLGPAVLLHSAAGGDGAVPVCPTQQVSVLFLPGLELRAPYKRRTRVQLLVTMGGY